MNDLDLAVFRAINGWPEGLRPFFVFLTNFTKEPAGLLILALATIGLIWWKPSRVPCILAVVCWPLADGATNLLKHWWQWPRPSWPESLLAHPEFIVRVDPLTSFGTASAHSANMMTVATCFLLFDRRLGAAWVTIAVLVGLSRIYVGVHWPSQVLLGWLVGAIVGTLAVLVYKKFGPRKPSESHLVEA
ncbi:MAG: phosphatase PAP2 family protein [Chthonomonadaceae bacterium]|nr:phosphatase PAP2 family protein [Chthonomonadaceae bacterium]